MLITLQCTAPPRSLDEGPANVQKTGTRARRGRAGNETPSVRPLLKLKGATHVAAHWGRHADLTTHGVCKFVTCTRRTDFSAIAMRPLTPKASSAFVIVMRDRLNPAFSRRLARSRVSHV